MKKHRGLLITAAILVLLAAAFFLYTGVYCHADDTALAALSSDGTVAVSETDFGWLFDGPSEDCALVFYPGGKVEETAYAPLLRRLAEEGMDVFLLRVPFRLAVLSPNKAADVMEHYSYGRWYVGGHSLGGAIAANFAASHGDALEGLILCAAYPTKELPADLTEILIAGSEDGVLNREKIEAGRQYAPEDYTEAVIEGGNHAQFGNYGAQRGDGTPAVTAEEQQAEAVRIITETLFPDKKPEV